MWYAELVAVHVILATVPAVAWTRWPPISGSPPLVFRSCVNVPVIVMAPGEPPAMASQITKSLATVVVRATLELGALQDVQEETTVPMAGVPSIPHPEHVTSRTVACSVAPLELVDVPVTVAAPAEVVELMKAAPLAVAVPKDDHVTPEQPAPLHVGALIAVKVLDVTAE